MSNTVIFIGGASASGKSTFVKELKIYFPSSLSYRRLDAFSDCAEKINCSKDKVFECVSSTDADRQFVEVCSKNECIISDVHYALQVNRDFKSSDNNSNLYVSTISDDLINTLTTNKTNIIATLITCGEEVLYERALNRFRKGERTMRATSVKDVIMQMKYERLKWFELYQKHDLLPIELDSEHFTPKEMTERFIEIISQNEDVKQLIKK